MALDDYSDAVFDAIKSHLTPLWTATPMQWPNEDFEPVGDASWVKVELHGTVYGQQSIGANVQADNRWDEEGILWLYVMVKRGIGTSQARGAGRALADIFRGLTLLGNSLEFMDANIGTGADQEGNWYMVPVSIEWRSIDA